ncbi:phage portal protein, HK97 family [Anaerosporobacter mobilis DSM 15930]|jgi:HK97 family phage portal protein|uniref:Phage portal protein, HK97 family n=1 Tax=Anaerosporobacter mobilis DSM 15930 TaxID=1120996 RepID=A0A1M7NKA9_9FIRM|nr:phage portal protein [Anaerosporobacter mobilis]SHN04262.1 phage portal protein, HK97 family [Anaerosporobacter mobilis DSM 15930]
MFWDKIEKRDTTANDWENLYSFENGYDNSVGANSGLNESTYFSCLKIISESVAKCPFQVRKETDKGESVATDHYLYDLLRLRPNPSMSAIDTFKTLVVLSRHYGIAGLLIDRKGGKVKALYPVRITNITIDDAGLINSTKNNKILYDYEGANGEYGSCLENNIMVLRDFTLDGVNSKATRSMLKESLDTSIKSQGYLNKLFQNGLTNKIVVQLTSDIKEEGELKKIQDKFGRIYSNNNRIFTVPAGYSVSSLNLSLSDAQFAELRGMSKKDIAGSMGVPLSKLGETVDNAKSDEQDNLSFLTDTLQVIFTQIEQEGDWKLLTETDRKKGFKIRANTNVMLRLDALTQAQVISTYVNDGVYSLNKAKEILGVEKLDKDVTTFPSGQVTLEQLMNNETSYTKNTAKSEVDEAIKEVGDDSGTNIS